MGFLYANKLVVYTVEGRLLLTSANINGYKVCTINIKGRIYFTETKRMLRDARCTVYTVHCTVYTVHCTLYTIHILHIQFHYILHYITYYITLYIEYYIYTVRIKVQFPRIGKGNNNKPALYLQKR